LMVPVVPPVQLGRTSARETNKTRKIVRSPFFMFTSF
jgi:hypothetical protein